MGKVFAWVFGFISGIVGGIALLAVGMEIDPDRYEMLLGYIKSLK